MAFYAISIVAGLFMLFSALLGFAGKVIPFTGMRDYTKESISKVARKMSLLYLITAAAFGVALYLDMSNKFSYAAYFIAIGITLIVLFIHIHFNKKYLQKN